MILIALQIKNSLDKTHKDCTMITLNFLMKHGSVNDISFHST